MPARFTDRVAIVTGGGSGIGLAVARCLGSEGARVVIADIDQRAAERGAGLAREGGAPDAWGATCDVSNETEVRSTVQGALDRWHRLDVIVNNAGLMVFKPLDQQTRDDWLRVLQVDLLGAFYFTREALLHMEPGGAIVNVSSIHAEETTPLVACYAAAKSALVSLTRSTSLEGKARGIRANAILPGAVDTPMLWKNPNIVSGIEKVERADVGKPEDIAAAIAFLASDEARFIQGVALRADGGRLDRL